MMEGTTPQLPYMHQNICACVQQALPQSGYL